MKEIKSYSRKIWGDQQTKKYLSEIKNGLETLAISPELGKTRDEIIDGARSFSIGRHTIFYRIGKAKIEVARILHSRMNVTQYYLK